MYNKLDYIIFTLILCNIVVYCASDNNVVKKSVANDNRDENGDTNEESKDESLDIPVEQNETPLHFYNVSCTRRQNSKMHEIKSATDRQFPFMAAILSHQDEYLCSGTVVSNGLILTTAHCLQQPVNYVLLNVTKPKKDSNAVTLRILKTDKFPTYSGTSDRDVGLIYTDKHNKSIASKVKLSSFTSAQQILDIEALGFGLNADINADKELQYIGLENRLGYGPEKKDMLRGYFDCIETKVVTCFKDTGGPVILNDELVGIVVEGQNECTKETSTNFALNKMYAEILPTYTFRTWLEEKIKSNEESTSLGLVSYPNIYVAPPQSRRQHNAAPAPRRRVAPVRRYVPSGSNKAILSFSSLLLYFVNIFL